MVVKQEKPSTSDFSSVEDVISDWKKRISDDWVEGILARAETSSNVRLLAERLHLNEVEAMTTYFSGMFASQI